MAWLMASLVLGIAAESLLADQCPLKEVQTEFNMTKYLGEWNEILRIPNIYEEGYSCMLDHFTLSPDGTTRVHSRAYNVSNHAYVFLDGVVTVSQPGRFDVTYNGTNRLRILQDMATLITVCCLLATAAVWSSSYWVLGTDYSTYAVLWGCLETDGLAPQRESTVRSRQGPGLAVL
ncbi:hypothetical protein Cfor_02885 [Coptotermes formosanus]|uniref:Lipocalin/cytosolic fatty-acid binding domain-containing protein n=1 Tax=Coptotermes formosanus TaxID=36987 RepID=A0A6L2Q3X3_COPFO|nr:hypothetical protein Cfor_02885 [Coptotermes formosanus]